MSSNAVTGQSLKYGAQGDPQYYPPASPRLARGTLVHQITDRNSPDQHAISLRGARGSKILRGASVGLMERLISKLDGTRSHDELSRELGIDREVVVQGLYLLLHAGVLVSGHEVISTDPASTDFIDHKKPQYNTLDSQLDMLCESTRRHESQHDFLDYIAKARIQVVGSPQTNNELRSVQAGVESVLNNYIDDLKQELPDYVVVFDPVNNMPVVRSSYARGSAVICVDISNEELIVGPVLLAGVGGCPECMLTWHTGRQRNRSPLADSTKYTLNLYVYLASMSIVGIIGVVGDRTILRSNLRINIRTGKSFVELSAPFLCGADCLTSHEKMSKEAIAVRQYEDMTQFLPERWRSPREHQRHYEGKSGKLVLESYTESGAHDRNADIVSLLRTYSLGLDEVLRAGVGTSYSEEGPRRYSPTGGNLGSVQVCLYTSGWPNIPDGHYEYLPDSEQLKLLAQPQYSFENDEAVMGVAELHLTSSVQRISSKYGATALKICAIDAGAAAANMESAAIANSLGTSLILRGSSITYAAAVAQHPSADMLTACLRLQVDGGKSV